MSAPWVRRERESFQAICEQCGWHTWPAADKDWPDRMAAAHAKVCPNPPPARTGAVMACGCWTFKVTPGTSVGRNASCVVHGATTWAQMNAPEPAAPSTGSPT